jgi:hypothetical protein
VLANESKMSGPPMQLCWFGSRDLSSGAMLAMFPNYRAAFLYCPVSLFLRTQSHSERAVRLHQSSSSAMRLLWPVAVMVQRQPRLRFPGRSSRFNRVSCLLLPLWATKYSHWMWHICRSCGSVCHLGMSNDGGSVPPMRRLD